jgi:hypothetical protein
VVMMGYVLTGVALCVIQYTDISMHICPVFACCNWMTKVRPPTYCNAPVRKHSCLYVLCDGLYIADLKLVFLIAQGYLL